MLSSTLVSLAFAALLGLAVADWDGLMRDEDAGSQSIGCGINDLKYGGLPSDSEYEELCTSANTYATLVTRSPRHLLRSLSSDSHATARPWCCTTTVPAASRMLRTQASTA